jgi:hypothetical protein
MRKTLLACLVIIVVLLGAPHFAQAQASVVSAKKAQLGITRNPTPEQLHALLTAVAKEVHGGLFVKTSGNQCLGHSCDIICFAGQSTMFDVLGSSETDAIPQWNATPFPAGGVCDMVASDTPDPPPSTDTGEQLAKIVESIQALDRRIEALERGSPTGPPPSDVAQQQLAATKAILELLQKVATKFGIQ